MAAALGSFVGEWAKAQKRRGPDLRKDNTVPVFYRNLEEELDASRANQTCAMFHMPDTPTDFSSCDVLGLGSSGAIKDEFIKELAANPDFQLGSHGTRLLNGNSAYLEKVEAEIAGFHGAESALFVGSGALGNDAIFSAVVRAGDAIVYDELVHASIHAGMKGSLALCKRAFRHNDVEALVDALVEVRDSQPQIRSGQRSVIIAVESFYSMDGDICPLKELVQAAKKVFPHGNAQFVIDEAHSNGSIGPQGKGMVNMLGLEREIAVRNHTFGKALSGSGAVILSNLTVRRMLINQAKPVLFSIVPPFPVIASARAGYNLLRGNKTKEAQDKVQSLVKIFMEEMTEHPVWDWANDAGFLRIPPYENDDWDAMPVVSPICPVLTKPRHNLYLAVHLQLEGFGVYPISFPVVPKGTDRIRLVFHAHNTEEEVKGLVASIGAWARETMECEIKNRAAKPGAGPLMCAAARHANQLFAKEAGA